MSDLSQNSSYVRFAVVLMPRNARMTARPTMTQHWVPKNELNRRFEHFGRTITQAVESFNYAVVISDDSVDRYDAATFFWLCGLAPPPEKVDDPNWMGDKS